MKVAAFNLKKGIGGISNVSTYLISVAIALSVGILSAAITLKDMNLYGEINRPFLSPPSYIFPIVWTLLYVLMGISSAIIFKKRNEFPKRSQDALFTYATSLIINFAWSIIFFKMRAFLLAFFWLVLLLSLVIKTVITYSKIDKTASLLQIPYVIWVSFAGYLTLAIYVLN